HAAFRIRSRMSDLKSKVADAVSSGQLLETSAANILQATGEGASEVTRRSVDELVAGGHWTELNDRFYRNLAFGTGGLRGRSIGKMVTKAERGTPTELGRPEFPCIGTNAMNYYNISRATQGLVTYLKEWLRKEGISRKPKIVL